jgi:hypothetical protein
MIHRHEAPPWACSLLDLICGNQGEIRNFYPSRVCGKRSYTQPRWLTTPCSCRKLAFYSVQFNRFAEARRLSTFQLEELLGFRSEHAKLSSFDLEMKWANCESNHFWLAVPRKSHWVLDETKVMYSLNICSFGHLQVPCGADKDDVGRRCATASRRI